ncbi:MAG TPA: rhodanese-like domain-containing protein [Candidatus Sulfotelmatobacter sp.]|nr:rhodanese-like domain-containing protein [Candidatus Sulfotelmatobacter sp.]
MDANTVFNRRDQLEIVDVREQDEWDAGHIEGAQHIPLSELQSRAAEIDREADIVTVCHSGQRSARAADFLAELGYRAENLWGGMLEWEDAGLPIVTRDGQPGTVI